MKIHALNGRWNVWVPNHVADWDGMTGDIALGTGWEAARLQSMQENLHWGDIVFDIGTEHAALAAVIAREFVGPNNMVLMEPSPEFWSNIEKVWRHNGLAHPLAVWPGFVGDKVEGEPYDTTTWPSWCIDAPEVNAMPYRYLNGETRADERPIGTITVDEMSRRIGHRPTALNIDVEGAELLVLRGAEEWMKGCYGGQHIFVSVHPDLMEPFGHTRQQLIDFVMSTGPWGHELLAIDHEHHDHFWSAPF